MREPIKRHSVVTLHDGREVQAVESTWSPAGFPLCHGCIAHGVDAITADCDALQSLCGSQIGQPTREDQFIFIPNTPEAFADYVAKRLEA
jgi:hypothetical protein